MRFENRPLAPFSRARNFDRKQTLWTESSQTTRPMVTPGPPVHPNPGARYHSAASRHLQNDTRTTFVLDNGHQIHSDRSISTVSRCVTTVTTEDPLKHYRYSGVWERKLFQILKKFRAKTSPFQQKAFLTTKRLGRRNIRLWQARGGRQRGLPRGDLPN